MIEPTPALITQFLERLGPLVFFSTETGDAWMLDPEDSLALCLTQDGDPQPARIVETPERLGRREALCAMCALPLALNLLDQ